MELRAVLQANCAALFVLKKEYKKRHKYIKTFPDQAPVDCLHKEAIKNPHTVKEH